MWKWDKIKPYFTSELNIYVKAELRTYRDGIIQMSQEMPNLRRFLALVFGCDNQMTIILEIFVSST